MATVTFEDASCGAGCRRRVDLADFLRSRRERLKPADVGLTAGSRRRTPGLRREEVARLAGVGITWYTRLEQGQDIVPSEQVVWAVARALRLSDAETRYLFALARNDALRPVSSTPHTTPARLRRIVRNLKPFPAYITGRVWDVLAWNATAEALFDGFAARPAGPKNLLWTVFVDPGRRLGLADWDVTARGLLAAFRESRANHAGDPESDDLVAALRAESAEFQGWWPRHDVGCSDADPKVFSHPTLGRLVLDLNTLEFGDQDDTRLTFYTPTSQADAAPKLRALARDGLASVSADGARATGTPPT
jgi:transcriptional regulator with XRE-family HTH domain